MWKCTVAVRVKLQLLIGIFIVVILLMISIPFHGHNEIPVEVRGHAKGQIQLGKNPYDRTKSRWLSKRCLSPINLNSSEIISNSVSPTLKISYGELMEKCLIENKDDAIVMKCDEKGSSKNGLQFFFSSTFSNIF